MAVYPSLDDIRSHPVVTDADLEVFGFVNGTREASRHGMAYNGDVPTAIRFQTLASASSYPNTLGRPDSNYCFTLRTSEERVKQIVAAIPVSHRIAMFVVLPPYTYFWGVGTLNTQTPYDQVVRADGVRFFRLCLSCSIDSPSAYDVSTISAPMLDATTMNSHISNALATDHGDRKRSLEYEPPEHHLPARVNFAFGIQFASMLEVRHARFLTDLGFLWVPSPMYSGDPHGLSDNYTPDYKIIRIRIATTPPSVVNLTVEVKPCENKISREVWKKCEDIAVVQGEYMALFYGTVSVPLQSSKQLQQLCPQQANQYVNTGGMRAYVWEPCNPTPTDNWVFMKDYSSDMPFLGRLLSSTENRHMHPRLLSAYVNANA